ncbi:MAG: OmpA family protein [Pseudomonadota bacterium]
MKKTVTAVIATSALILASGANAADSSRTTSKSEAIGFGSGAVIGAAAAGPFGFVIGAGIGVLIGEKMHNQNEEIEHLSAALDTSQAKVARLNDGVIELRGSNEELLSEIRRIEPYARPELVNLMQAGIAMDLLFRTDEDALADTTGERLSELAATLAGMNDVRIQLDGFADERGDAEYNQGLSERRVHFVRDQLIAAGVPAQRISFNAHGEAVAQDEKADSLALERRVTLKVFIDESTPVAANQR